MTGDRLRPRIIVVTRNLPPLIGGMERLIHRMIMGMHDWADVEVIGPAGFGQHLPADVGTHEVPIRPLWRFLLRAFEKALGVAQTFKPDVVIGGSGLVAPIILLVARYCRARSVVYVHGLDVVTDHWLYRRLWLPAIRRCDAVIANSRNTREMAIQRGVDPSRMTVVNPGTDIPAQDPNARARFRERYGLGARPVLLSVGRLTARKGLPEFVSNCLSAILEERPDTLLVVVGDDAVDALHRSGAEKGRALLQVAAERHDVAAAIRLLGPCDDATLSEAYQAADLHVFPVREIAGDVEGFGMVVIEAAAHGLPTVAFRVGGVPDALFEGRNGSLVRAGDYQSFSARTLHWLATGGTEETSKGCRMVAHQFSWEIFAARMRSATYPFSERTP